MSDLEARIEGLREQIVGLQAILRPLLAERRTIRANEARERRMARLERRRDLIAEMLVLHRAGLSYREIAQRVGLSRDYVADLVLTEARRS